MNEKYITGKEASEKLGVQRRTLYQWDKKRLDRNNKNIW